MAHKTSFGVSDKALFSITFTLQNRLIREVGFVFDFEQCKRLKMTKETFENTPMGENKPNAPNDVKSLTNSKSRCGCSLRGCSLIIGIGHLIQSATLTFLMAIYWPEIAAGENMFTSETENATFMLLAAILSVTILINLSLVYGSCCERVHFIYMWIVLYWIHASITLMMVLQYGIDTFTKTDGGESFQHTILSFMVFAMDVYCIGIVYSYWCHLRSSQSPNSLPPVFLSAYSRYVNNMKAEKLKIEPVHSTSETIPIKVVYAHEDLE